MSFKLSFESAASLQAARESLKGKKIGENEITVSVYQRSLSFFGNIGLEVDNTAFRTLLSEFGTVVRAFVIRDPATGISTGLGFDDCMPCHNFNDLFQWV